jgi:hypothetical protein
MTPTPKLRWINRPMPNLTSYVERVLQQWWEKKNGRMTLKLWLTANGVTYLWRKKHDTRSIEAVGA